jgi:hypothetical protein
MSFYHLASMDNYPNIGGGWSAVDRTYGRGSSYADSSTPEPPNSLKARWLSYQEAYNLGLPMLHDEPEWEPYGYYLSAREPISASVNFGGQYRKVYVQYYFKYDTNWVYNATMDKQFYFFTPSVYAPILFVIRKRSDGLIWPTLYEGGNISGNPGYVNLSYQNVNTNNMKFYSPGTWMKVYIEADAGTSHNNDGYVKIWIDDVQTHYVTNIPILYSVSDTGFSYCHLSPVWGGDANSRLPNGQSMSQYFDRLIVSSDPISNIPDTDTTPPYTDQFLPVENATGVLKSNRTISFHIKDV